LYCKVFSEDNANHYFSNCFFEFTPVGGNPDLGTLDGTIVHIRKLLFENHSDFTPEKEGTGPNERKKYPSQK
jgi:hypothetical protein